LIVLTHRATAARRWLAHLVRAAEGSIRRGDGFDGSDPFEDSAVLRAAQRFRLAPLLHRAAADGRLADPLSPGFREACERIYYATLRKNLVALDAAEPLLPELARVGIPAAPLKGWAFVAGDAPLYADCGTRPMDDLDLIVSAADAEKAARVIEAHGFRRTTGGRAALRGGHEIAFHRRSASVDVFVELHWAWAGPESLMREFGVTGTRFLEELCEQTPDGARRPTPLGHALFTALHAARHALDRWIWLVDLHRLVSRDATPWPELLEGAERWRVRRPLYAALAATRELLRTPIPKEVLAALAPGPVRRRLLHRSLARSGEASARTSRAAWTAKLLLGESWWDVARTAAWAAAPGADWFEARGREASWAARAAHPLRAAVPGGARPGAPGPQERS